MKDALGRSFLRKDVVIDCALAVLFGAVALWPASSARAQSTDWETLRTIPAGSKIKVKLKQRWMFGHCRLEKVTDDYLACYFNALGTRHYARDEIKAVFLGRHSARFGLEVGAGAGVVLGATHGCCGGSGRISNVIILAPLLGGIGAGIGALVDPFVDGKAVYRSSNSAPAMDKSKPQVSPAREYGAGENISAQR
jgi:hypothetical protein